MEKKHIKDRNYFLTMPDNSLWAVPVEVIARDRAEYYKHEFGDDLERSLEEDTYPLFESDNSYIMTWASGNMNWVDVEDFADKVEEAEILVDFEEGWVDHSSWFVK